MDEDKIIFEYVNNKKSLRMIAQEFNTDHHRIKRILVKNKIEISNNDRKRKPLPPTHSKNLSNALKGRKSWSEGKKMSLDSRYLNMKNHLQWDVDLEWLKSFQDIERLKFLNGLLSRKRDSQHFDTNRYK